MTTIRLSKSNKTIKIVNRKDNIRLTKDQNKITLDHTGKVGPIGNTGATGPQGDQGFTGPIGPPIQILGTLSSTADLPVTADAGDAYIILGDLYVWEELSHSWLNVGPISGPTGVQGESGATGAQGVQGSTGSTGPAGNTGSTGPQGNTGTQGATGSQGIQGIQGGQGNTGATGVQGATGPQGNQGATGAGATGVQGATGVAGMNGSDGSTGATGVQGVQGSTGATGVQGTAGTQGSTGPTGALGNTGVQGTTGPTGATGPAPGLVYIFSNTTTFPAPSARIRFNNATAASVTQVNFSETANGGIDATTFLDTITVGTILNINDSAAKNTVFLVTGATDNGTDRTYDVTYLGGISIFANAATIYVNISPKGATGATGAQGTTGPTGAAGNTGSQGATGSAGSQGSTGATGANGAQGATGATGNTGETGPQGSTGPSPVNYARVTVNTNKNVSNPGGNIFDSTGLSNGDRVLLTGQSTSSQNGVWVFNGSSSAMTRPTDFPSGGTIVGGTLFVVTEGTVFGDTLWILTTNGSVTIDTGVQAWAQRGVQGTTGPTGANGNTGATGAQGNTGATGSAGTQGSTGATGVQGATGPQGNTGTAGTQGSTGATGAGATGATGPQGATGAGGSVNPVYFNVKDYGAIGDGSTDDTSSIQDAIDAAVATSNTSAAVYFPAGKYKTTSALNANGTGNTGGNGVYLIGDGIEASKIRKLHTGVGVTWNGSGGPDDTPSKYGGLRNITIDCNDNAGIVVQTNSAQQMLFESCKIQSAADKAFDLNTTQDSWFVNVMINNCGSSSAAAIDIYGSADGTSNMLWFINLRVETFLAGAVTLRQGSGQSNKNNGLYFRNIKLESINTRGDAFSADDYNEDVLVDGYFCSMTGFDSGYSTPANAIYSRAVNKVVYRNIWANSASSAIDAIINVQCQNGILVMDNLFLSGDEPVTGLVVFASNNFDTKIFVGAVDSTYGDSIDRFVYQSTANTDNTYSRVSQMPSVFEDNTSLQQHELRIKSIDDDAHALKYDSGVDGPILQGWEGGQLVTVDGDVVSLAWGPSGVSVPGFQMTGGSPGTGKFLVSDSGGNASWGPGGAMQAITITSDTSPAELNTVYYIDSSSNPVTLELPDTTIDNYGALVRVVLVDNSNDVTITTVSGGNAVGDSSSQSLTLNETGFTVQSDYLTGRWHMVEDNRTPGGITAVVDDTAPQLGGDLDGNSFGINNLDSIRFMESPSEFPTSVGSTWYDSFSDSLDTFGSVTDASVHIGQDVFARIYNDSGSTIPKGSVVYATGGEGSTFRLTIDLAEADDISTARVVGVASYDITDATPGLVLRTGYIIGLDTSGFSAGDPLWLSDSVAGGLTNSQPSINSFIGWVSISDATSGVVYIAVEGAIEGGGGGGATGATGPAGATGANVYVDTDPPGGTPQTGDLWFDTDETEGLGGPQGATGPSGPDGPTGATGPAGGATTAYTPTLANVANTASQTTTVSASIPGNDMADGDYIDMMFTVLGKNNKGSGGTISLDMFWGSGNVNILSGQPWTDNANEFKGMFWLRVVRVGSDLWVSTANSSNGGIASFGGTQSGWTAPLVISGPTFSSTQTLALKVTLSAADATFYFKPQGARITRIHL